jgi:predicted porin
METRMTASIRALKPIAWAACSLMAAAPAAWAQNTGITLSGIVDLAVRNVDNEGPGSLKSMLSGSNSTSRLIVSGREQMGGDLAAGFHLEHGILADTGAGSGGAKFWDRRSTVSLFSKSAGELRLGRDFVPSYTSWSRYDPFAYVGVARSANFVSATPVGPIRSAFSTNANTTVRADNGIQWFLPGGLGGWEGSVMLTPSEGGAAASGLAKVIGVRLGFSQPGWNVSAATTTSQNNLTTVGKFRDTTFGGQVEIAGVRVAAAWREFRYADTKQVMTLLAAQKSFGPHEVKGSWIQSNQKGRVGATVVDANDASQLGLGYVYNLSKRSALYASVAQVSNDGAARYVISDGPAGIVAGGSSRGYEFGMRHRF